MKDNRKENEKKRKPPLKFTELTEVDVQDHADDLCRHSIYNTAHAKIIIRSEMDMCMARFIRTFQ